MCGIGCIINLDSQNDSVERKKSVTGAIINTLVALESRGSQATGLYAIKEDRIHKSVCIEMP